MPRPSFGRRLMLGSFTSIAVPLAVLSHLLRELYQMKTTLVPILLSITDSDVPQEARPRPNGGLAGTCLISKFNGVFNLVTRQLR